MPIDWFTVAAQALNFIVLVWLLERFLYGPILRAIDAREKRVADELADATAQQAHARQERDAFSRRNAEFDRQREQQSAQVQAQVVQQRQQLLEQARADAEAWRARRLASLRAEAAQQGQVLRGQVQQEVFAVVRKALQDLASDDLEQRVCTVFVARLRRLDAAQRDVLVSALGGDAPVQVRSAFALAAPQRATIESALSELLGRSVAVQYGVDAELVGGIEVLGGGHKVGWNIDDYLDAMEHNVAQRLQQLTEPVSEPAATADAQPPTPADAAEVRDGAHQ